MQFLVRLSSRHHPASTRLQNLKPISFQPFTLRPSNQRVKRATPSRPRPLQLNNRRTLSPPPPSNHSFKQNHHNGSYLKKNKRLCNSERQKFCKLIATGAGGAGGAGGHIWKMYEVQSVCTGGQQKPERSGCA